MRSIKLTFSDEKCIDGLINDKMFMADITYLQPNRLDRLNLALYDPVAGHHQLDTEIVVLNKFARAIKRHFFANTAHDAVFLSNNSQSLKGGLRHDQERKISSTDVQVDFTIQVKQV